MKDRKKVGGRQKKEITQKNSKSQKILKVNSQIVFFKLYSLFTESFPL